MSADEDAAVVRALADAFNRNDPAAIAAVVAEDAELYPLRAQLDGRVYHGKDGGAQASADIHEDWEPWEAEVDDVVSVPDGVVCSARVRARGRVSGVDLDISLGAHVRIADGLVTYFRTYSDLAKAMRAAGADPAGE